MLRKLVLGVAAALSFGGLALVSAPASAAPVAAGVVQTQAAPGDLVQQAQYYYGPRRRYYGPRRYYAPPRIYRPRPFYGRRYYGPQRFYGPRPFYGRRYYY